MLSRALHSRDGADGYAVGGEVFFCLGDGVFAEVEDGGGEGGVGFALGEGFAEVFEGARTAGCDDGNGHGLGDAAGDFTVVAVLRAIGVHGGEEDFARTALLRFDGPGHRLEGRSTAAVAAAVTLHNVGTVFLLLRVDSDDDALRAEGDRMRR